MEKKRWESLIKSVQYWLKYNLKCPPREMDPLSLDCLLWFCILTRAFTPFGFILACSLCPISSLTRFQATWEESYALRICPYLGCWICLSPSSFSEVQAKPYVDVWRAGMGVCGPPCVPGRESMAVYIGLLVLERVCRCMYFLECVWTCTRGYVIR